MHDTIREVVAKTVKEVVVDMVSKTLTYHTKVTVEVVIPRPADDPKR